MVDIETSAISLIVHGMAIFVALVKIFWEIFKAISRIDKEWRVKGKNNDLFYLLILLGAIVWDFILASIHIILIQYGCNVMLGIGNWIIGISFVICLLSNIKTVKEKTNNNKLYILLVYAPFILMIFPLINAGILDNKFKIFADCCVGAVFGCEIIGLLVFEEKYIIYEYSNVNIYSKSGETLKNVEIDKVHRKKKWLVIKREQEECRILFDDIYKYEYMGEPKYIERVRLIDKILGWRLTKKDLGEKLTLRIDKKVAKENILFKVSLGITILFLLSPLLLRVDWIYESMQKFIEPLVEKEYKGAYISGLGAILGTFVAVTGVVWTQQIIDKKKEKEKIHNCAMAICRDLKYSLDGIKEFEGAYAYIKPGTPNEYDDVSMFRLYSKNIRIYIDSDWMHTTVNLCKMLSQEQYELLNKLYMDLERIKSAFEMDSKLDENVCRGIYNIIMQDFVDLTLAPVIEVKVKNSVIDLLETLEKL